LDDLDAAAAASAASLKDQLHKLQQQLLQILSAQDTLNEQLDKEPGKYQIRKMGAGSIEHFHSGLTDRIGKRCLAAFAFRLLFYVWPQVHQIWTLRRPCALSIAAWAAALFHSQPRITTLRQHRNRSGGTSLVTTTACAGHVPICFMSAALCPLRSCWEQNLLSEPS
jgi:hypothetical protein